ncbi:MAG: hypothetical protein ACI945_001210 [Pseudohongiellaceae bacterium]|jgi:hypothetical protein
MRRNIAATSKLIVVIIGAIVMARSVIVACCLYHLAGTAAAQGPPESVYVDITPSFVNNYDEGVRLKYRKHEYPSRLRPRARL